MPDLFSLPWYTLAQRKEQSRDEFHRRELFPLGRSDKAHATLDRISIVAEKIDTA